MNKIKKVLLAIFGAIDAVMYISTPILLALLGIKLFGLTDISSYLFYGVGVCSTLYRAFKIGWFKFEEKDE